MLKLIPIKRTEENLLLNMSNHYSQPKGFVGRNICYSIEYDNKYFGSIVGGSATKWLVGRDEFFNVKYQNWELTNIINNIFYHLLNREKYPIRNFSSFIVKEFRKKIVEDWYNKYKDEVIGFETLVELPRTGDLYKKDGWTEVGITKGFSCKRVSGKGTDSWSGKRIWNTTELRPKRVFCRYV